MKVIFTPIEPIKPKLCCGKIVLHGLFLRRQKEVCELYALSTPKRCSIPREALWIMFEKVMS